ncbi:MAG: pyruvate kinase [Bacillota bacterium]|nr:pyruvate kinase [Bacillota bacterium]
MKATKIVCTLGPASAGLDVMKDMIDAGMNVARLNFSHGSHEEHLEKIKTYRQACADKGVPAAIMLDTKGPEIRLGEFPEKTFIQKGQKFILYCSRDVTGSSEGVSISYKGLAGQVSKGTAILIDDGKLRMEVQAVENGDILCIAKDEGFVSTKKGVNVPEIHLDMDYLSQRDQEDLLFGIQQDVDYVASSFVRSVDDVRCLRTFLDDNGGEAIKIISKIENPEGIRNFDAILEASDGIMVARGDMGVEVDFATIPGIQKSFIDKCIKAGKPVITATQMLESMISEPVPTRAEITDVANAVFDGTSAVMLSGESAAGNYPALTVSVMSRILEQAEEDLKNSSRFKTIEEVYSESLISGAVDLSTAIGHAACQVADHIGAKALIAITQSGYTALMMARFHPDKPIIAATPSAKVSRQMALIRGVHPVMTEEASNLEELIQSAKTNAMELGFLQSGDRIVVSAGLPLRVAGNTNTIRVETI